MTVEIEKAKDIGFCFGVRRAIDMLDKAARENGNIETLGAVVHNDQVTQSLMNKGIKAIHNLNELNSKNLAISSHGVTPQMYSDIRERGIQIIDTTCPFVRRAQTTASKFAEEGFWVIVFGDAEHVEVKGIMGWAQGKGIATIDVGTAVASLKKPYRLGILAQTTQIPEKFIRFVKDIIDLTLTKDTEIRIVDTICHDLQMRQPNTLKFAKKVDLMLVVGGRESANSKHLMELCATATETHLISEAKDIDLAWLKGKKHIGVSSGTSTSDETIDEVINFLHNILNSQ